MHIEISMHIYSILWQDYLQVQEDTSIFSIPINEISTKGEKKIKILPSEKFRVSFFFFFFFQA